MMRVQKPVEQATVESSAKEEQVPRTILREFGLNTSTHGIPGIARSESLPNRLYWTICLLAFTGVMIYFTSESIRAYFRYPTQTIVSVNALPTVLFPAVSFCNYSPLRYDRFIGSFLNYMNTTAFSLEQASHVQDFLRDQVNSNNSLSDYFYSLESMLLSCQYNGLNCSSEDFVSFVTPRYGQCHTFNAKSKHRNTSALRSIFDNAGYGVLYLELYVHRHQYIPYLSKGTSSKQSHMKCMKLSSSSGAGVVMAVHENQQMPFMSHVGYYLRPGQMHRVTYTIKNQYRLGEAYSQCENNMPLSVKAIFDQFSSTDYKYDHMVCNFACIQSYV